MTINEGSTIRSRSGTSYTLEKEIGAGGEGRVFKVRNLNVVAKIYKKVVGDIEDKIVYMVDHRIHNLTDTNGDAVMMLAWPQDVLYDDNGQFVGYIMPFAEKGVGIFNISRGCDTPDSKQMFPNYTRIHNVVVALNLARAVAHLHSHNCIIGDMNCKNILIGPKCSIIILDNDSFDMTDPATGRHFKCTAGTQEYLAPELQGRNLRSDSAQFTMESDCFSLAIHIFQLLMNNFHPFTGKNLAVIQNSSSVNQQLQNIQNGRCPFIKNFADLQIPVAAPYLSEMVTPELAENFRRTFDYDASTVLSQKSQRVSAMAWSNDLYNYLLRLQPNTERQVCTKDPTHIYVRSLGQCGLCAAEARYQNYLNSRRPSPRPAGISHTPAAATSGSTSAAASYSSGSSSTASSYSSGSSSAASSYSSGSGSSASSYHSGSSGSSTSANSSSSGGKKVMIWIAVIVALLVLLANLDFGGKSSKPAKPDKPRVEAPAEPYTPADSPDDSPEYVEGDWATANDGSQFDGNRIFKLEQAVSCKSLSVYYKVNTTKGTPCKYWDVFVRNYGTWVKVGTMYYSSGNGEQNQKFQLPHGMHVDAVTVWPDTDGELSWKNSIGVYDIVKCAESEVIASDDEPSGQWVDAHWASEQVYFGSIHTTPLILDRDIKNCRKIKVYFDVEMKYNSSCKDWDVYGCDANSWKKIGGLYLENGNGEVEKVINLPSKMDLRGVAIIPRISGSYSWSSSIAVCDMN